jgi:hypothetical protein
MITVLERKCLDFKHFRSELMIMTPKPPPKAKVAPAPLEDALGKAT